MQYPHITITTGTFNCRKTISSEHRVLIIKYLTVLSACVFLYIKPGRHDKDSGLLGHNVCMWLHISQTIWRNVSPSSSRVGSPGHKQYFLLWRGYGGCDAHPSIREAELWGSSRLLQTRITASIVWQLDKTRWCLLPSVCWIALDLNPLKMKETRTSYSAMQHHIQVEQNPWL
jgi:hypothetical protein